MVNKIKPVWYILIGVILIASAHLTCSIGVIGWVSSVPFLIYLSITKGIKSRLWFVLALIIGWSLATLKIITPPIAIPMAFLFSVPIGLIQIPGYLLWAKFRAYKLSYLLFPAIMILMEWMQYNFTPFGSWGIAAYTQMNNLILMQSVSLFGLAGLSFLIYWVNIILAETLLKGNLSIKKISVPVFVLVTIIIFGSLRYALSRSKGQKVMTVAAVCTNSNVAGLPLPSKEITEKDERSLFERTRIAAHSHAQLVVWNEASIGILQKDEEAWKDSLSSLAAELRIVLIAAYVMPVSEKPLRYENKYLLVQSDGNIALTYLKHQPVPGEPAIKGESPFQIVEADKVKIGGAICYDYDFPYIANELGKLRADIVALPSSDWRGIDPIHTQMASFRAIEQGHSILRSTRFGLSASINPYGEMTSQMSSFDNNDKIMLSHLPQTGIVTLYSIIGDILVYFSAAFILIYIFFIVFRLKIPT